MVEDRNRRTAFVNKQIYFRDMWSVADFLTNSAKGLVLWNYVCYRNIDSSFVGEYNNDDFLDSYDENNEINLNVRHPPECK
jgi:hypothetical protein